MKLLLARSQLRVLGGKTHMYRTCTTFQLIMKALNPLPHAQTTSSAFLPIQGTSASGIYAHEWQRIPRASVCQIHAYAPANFPPFWVLESGAFDQFQDPLYLGLHIKNYTLHYLKMAVVSIRNINVRKKCHTPYCAS